MKSLRILLVDDEARIRSSLKNILQLYYPSGNVVAEAENVSTAADAIREHRPDVVLLDIKMNDGTGFDLLRSFPVKDFKVIFITAFDSYALQAIKFSAMDYLLKPVDPDELVKVLQKAQQHVNEEETRLKMEAFMHNIKDVSKPSKRIVLNTQEAMHIIEASDIVRCEADRNYTRFVLKSGKSILVSGSLKEYDDMLNGSGFFRSHHSHLVNLAFIDRFDKRDGGRLIMKDGSEIPLSLRKKEDLIAALQM